MEEIDWENYELFFVKAEFDCKETGENKMHPDFMDAIYTLRHDYGKPMIVTSGYRSVCHSIEAKKNKPGEHTTGYCADFAVRSGSERYELVKLALAHGFTRIGIADTFVHIGMNAEYPQNVIWTY